jgi:hypothetical protein
MTDDTLLLLCVVLACLALAYVLTCAFLYVLLGGPLGLLKAQATAREQDIRAKPVGMLSAQELNERWEKWHS